MSFIQRNAEYICLGILIALMLLPGACIQLQHKAQKKHPLQQVGQTTECVFGENTPNFTLCYKVD